MLNAGVALFNQKLEDVESKTFRNKVIRFFPETFLGNGHLGLSTIAKKHGLDLQRLRAGEYVIFMNKTQTGLKMFTSGNIIAYLKMPGSQRINPNVIVKIPKFFNGTEIQYDKALREVIEKQFKRND